MAIRRGRFQGVLNIISFNRHFYWLGFIALAAIVVSKLFFNWSNGLYWWVLWGFAYGLITPLIVSAYVYDLSGYYDLNWLKEMKLSDSTDNLNLNIHAGFDETSFTIKSILPLSKLQVYDFYDAKQHTEPAIVRARRVSQTYPDAQRVNTHYIPQVDQSVDHIFLLAALHEIRNHQEKVIFLKECRRVCKSSGRLIMVEHLRDLPNFLAFSVGFTHFFSKKTWIQAFEEAGFSCIEEKKLTPFMSIFKAIP